MKKSDELALQIQQGRKDLIIDLWEEVKRYIFMHANRFYNIISAGRTPPGGVTVEDLKQCGFLAMIEAAAAYDSTRGAFTTFLTYYLKKHFNQAIGRTEKQRREPLNNCTSLDVPIDEDGENTLLDFIPDSRDEFAVVEEKIYQEQLHNALETALNTLPKAEADTIRAEFFDGKKQSEIAAKMGVSQERARQLRNGGLRHIRTSSARVKLERFIDSETNFYKYVSVYQFNRTSTSAVEYLTFIRERQRNSARGQI